MFIQESRLRRLALSLPSRLTPQTVFYDRRQRSQNAVPDLLDRLKTALADRYAIEIARSYRRCMGPRAVFTVDSTVD